MASMASSSGDTLYYFLFIVWCLTALVVRSLLRRPRQVGGKPAAVQRPPPSPPALPIIGHLHLIGHVLPVSLQGLARRHGPLMGIRLGASSCVVVSSEAVAREIFKTQELNFSSRPEFGSSEYFMYRGSRFVMAQYGDYWRFMKKLCMTRLLAVPQLGKYPCRRTNSGPGWHRFFKIKFINRWLRFFMTVTDKFVDVREEEVERIVESVAKAARAGEPTDLSGEFTTLTNNIICRMAMSTRCMGTSSDAEEIKRLVRTCLELAGKLSVGDILGPLKFLDFSRNGEKLVSALLKFDQIVERIIKEHETSGSDGKERKDVLDILLETYEDPGAEVKITRKDIKSFLLVSVIDDLYDEI